RFSFRPPSLDTPFGTGGVATSSGSPSVATNAGRPLTFIVTSAADRSARAVHRWITLNFAVLLSTLSLNAGFGCALTADWKRIRVWYLSSRPTGSGRGSPSMPTGPFPSIDTPVLLSTTAKSLIVRFQLFPGSMVIFRPLGSTATMVYVVRPAPEVISKVSPGKPSPGATPF